jgi:hypothetical protein
MPALIDRRRFLWATGAAGLGLATGVRSQTRAPAVAANSKLRVLSIGT